MARWKVKTERETAHNSVFAVSFAHTNAFQHFANTQNVRRMPMKEYMEARKMKIGMMCLWNAANGPSIHAELVGKA